MWTRKELKETGKAALKANYWPSVLVAFILSLLTAGTTVASRSSGQEEATDQTINQAGDAFQSLTPEQQTLAILGISAAVGTVAIVALLLKIFLFNPLKVGCYGFFKENVQKREFRIAAHREQKAKKVVLLNEEKSQLEKELSSLGLFAFSRKGEIKSRLATIAAEIAKLSN